MGDGTLAKKLKEGLDANYPARFSAKTGNLIQEGAPDHLNRRGYLDMAFRLKGSYAPEKRETTERKIVINLNLPAVQGLVDSGAITIEEAEELKALPSGDDDCISLPKSATPTGG